MATLEDELKDLKEKNNELALKVQYWKMTAAQKEDDRISLMKENNELRLKLSRLRNNGGLQARKLDTALQTASEKALSHLVKASAEIARTMDIAKAYIRDRQELDAQSPRWSTLSNTPNSHKKDKVHRVPPMVGGQSIQPVVALSRTLLTTNNPVTSRGPQTMTPVLVTTSRGPGPNRSGTERAVPMHMLQDVYIPLTRIDVSELQNNNMETDTDTNNAEDSTEELDLDDSVERIEEGQPTSEEEDFEERRLHVVTEEEPEDEMETPPRNRLENPLEGPSWLLDTPTNSNTSKSKSRSNLEPDSTTEMDSTLRASAGVADQINDDSTESDRVPLSLRVSCEFSPTVRRRKRTSSPPAATTPRQHHYSPRPLSSRRNSNSGRVLKVLVAKMRLDGEEAAGGDASPPKRARSPSPAHAHAHTPAGGGGGGGRDGAARGGDAAASLLPFDAPSPNGATDSGVIVSETRTNQSENESITHRVARNMSRRDSRDSQRSTNKHTHDQHAKTSQDGQHTSRPPTFDGQQTKSEQSRSFDQHRGASIESRRGNRIGSCDSVVGSIDSRDSDSGSGGGGDSISEGRTRRNRKMVTYKEKPLNRKMRR